MSVIEASTLYIVATPIGNLGDISQRAIDVFKQVDLVCAEDTRHSRKLMQHLDVEVKQQSLHDHNEKDKAQLIINWLQQGQSIALISDAGTPLISDPGYHLVNLARQAGVKVVPVPGACALISALSASGLPTDRFHFEGFVNAKTHARQASFTELAQLAHTWVYYESTHRILDSLKDLHNVLGERTICVARELTKTFESFYHGSITEVISTLEQDHNQRKGEFVVMVAGAEKAQHSSEAEKLR